MKPLHLFTLLLTAVMPATAADPKNPPPARPVHEKKDPPKKPDSLLPATSAKTEMTDADMVTLLKPYDKNGDYQIDLIEFTAIEAEFKKHPQGPLKQFDKGKDGALDALIDRAYMNVKLGGAAAKKDASAPPPPVKKADPPKPPATPAPAPGTKKPA